MKEEIGTVTSWNDEKGFGFITPASGGKQIFLHINQYSNEHKRPNQGLAVTFASGKDARGRNCAVSVCPLRGHKKVSRAERQFLLSTIFSFIFFVAIGMMVFAHRLPLLVLGVYVFFSFVTFFVYRRDKYAAEWSDWRTPEKTLHILSILGGWPGALVAQSKLRHKSKKVSFKTVYWLTVIINLSILIFMLTPDGSKMLNPIIENIRLGIVTVFDGL